MTDEEIDVIFTRWEARQADPAVAGRGIAEAAARRELGPGAPAWLVAVAARLVLRQFVRHAEATRRRFRERGRDILRAASREHADLAVQLAVDPAVSMADAVARLRSLAAAPTARDDRPAEVPAAEVDQTLARHADAIAAGRWPLEARRAIVEHVLATTPGRTEADRATDERVRRILLHPAAERHWAKARALANDPRVPLAVALATLGRLMVDAKPN